MTSDQKINKAMSLVPYSGSATLFFKYVAESANNRQKLFQEIRTCQVDQSKCRFNIWRMLLGICSINNNINDKIEQLNDQRNKFKQKKSEAYTSVGSFKKQNVVIPKNPLMKAMVKPTTKVQQTDDQFLKDQIRKDVQRTYQQNQFFQQQCILKILSTVLFIWCKRNPQVSYKQGMNEILASIVYVYFQEVYVPGRKPDGFSQLSQENKKIYLLFNDIEYAEPDIYGVFEKIMNIQNQMYKTETDSNLKGVINPNSKNNTPILQRIITIIDQKLKALDIQLFRTIKLQDVQTKTFLLRWIRCMHTRQFTLQCSFIIWDSIFLDYYECPSSKQKSQFQFIDAMCVAMFIYMRSIALTRQTAYEILQIYQKYPSLKKGGYLQQLISLAWSLCEALRQPQTASNSSDWVGQQNTKRDNKLQFLKSRQPSKSEQKIVQKPKQTKPVVVQNNKQVKQIKKVEFQTKSPPVQAQKKRSIPQQESTNNQFSEQVQERKQVMQQFDFNITLDSFEWQTLVEKLQKSLALNTDEQSRKYILQGLEIIKLKVQNTSHRN